MTQNINPQVESVPTSEPAETELTVEEELAKLVQNPVGFVREIVSKEAVQHLARLKEEAELRGAINVFRRQYPDFTKFEPMILQEVVTLIQNDPDGDIDPWDKLLEKAMNQFRKKFKALIENEKLKSTAESSPPFVEGSRNRILPEQPPTFTRDQIAGMSMAEYLKNEAAIDDALKNKRIV